MSPRIAIVGAGAIGGYVGAHMTKAGLDVVLIDAWPAHVEAMRERGMEVVAMQPEAEVHVPVRALHLCDVPQLIRERPFDVALIAVKSYDTEWATALILPYLAPDGCLVSLQNSINEDRIAAVAGWGRTLGCSLSTLAAELVAPGRISRNSPLGTAGKVGLRVGEAHGRVTPRARAVAEALSHADTAGVTTNLWGERWSKLTINAMRNGVSALTGMTGKQRDTDPRARDLTIRLGSSCVRVGLAMGLSLEPVSGLDLSLLARVGEDPDALRQITDLIVAMAHTRNDEQRPSMGQDILKGRRTETEWINGLVARRGEEYGVDASIHARVNAVVKRVERGEVAPSPALLDRL
jgi:2-dehydropantoate 2-reductase